MEAEQVQTKALITSIGIIIAVECAMRLVLPKQPFDSIIALGAARLLEVTLVILFLMIWGQGISSIGLVTSEMVAGFKKGLIWSVGFGIVVLLVFAVLYMAGINIMALIHARLPKEPRNIVLFFLGLFQGNTLRFLSAMGGDGGADVEHTIFCTGSLYFSRSLRATGGGGHTLCYRL